MDRDKNRNLTNLSTPAGRVAWVLQRVWQGSQSRMGRDIGVTQSAVSAIVTGKRKPGRRFLAQLAAYPMINANWLFNALGEPLVVEEQPGHGGHYFCPVAAGPLPGPPRGCREKLTGQYRPVAAPDFSEDRYWLMVDTDEFADKGLLEGDWLLVDADNSWLERPETIAGQPCVVRAGTRKDPTYGTHWLQYEADTKPTGKFVVDVLAVDDDEPKYPETRRARKVTLKDPNTSTKKSETRPAKTLGARVPLKNVVAIAVKLERPWI